MASDAKSSQNVGNDTKDKSSDGEIPIMKRFMKLVKSLNTISKTGAEKALRQIRDDILKHSACIKYLCENKSFKSITKFLDLPNEKLLNLSISILATCCVNEESRIQVRECKAIRQISFVLKSISQDGVQNRACRLVANLAQSKDIVHELHKHNVVDSIIKILSSNSSSGTQQSGIRALRVLWESLPHVDWNIRESMLRAGVAQVVSEALKTPNKDLTQCALRALQSFTDIRGARHCMVQLSPSFYPLLIANFHTPVACQVAINLSRVPEGLKNLNECYALKSIINIFAISVLPAYTTDTASASCSSEASAAPSPCLIISDSRHIYLLSVLLCKLSTEVIGRTQLLNLENGSSVFLHMLEKEKNHTIKMQLFQVLGQFALEPATLKYLAKNGLVQILVNKLERYTITHAKPHVKAKNLTCSATDLALEDLSGSQFSWGSASSPFSDASPSRTSPGRAFCASPTASSDRSGSPRFAYSPVCSSSGIDSDAPDDDCHLLFREMETNMSSLYQNTPPLSEKEDAQVIYVLEKLTHGVGTLDDLVSTKTIDTILNYKVLVNQTYCKLINFLETIVGKKQYYTQLLDGEFVLKLHRAWCRPLHSSCCSQCEALCFAGDRVLMACAALAETGLGEGEMAHRLLKGRSDTVKLNIALTVPLVIGDIKLLVRLLYKYHAYDILTTPLYESTSDEAVLEDIAFSIKELFKTLEFTNPQIRSIETCRGCDILSLRRAASVTFLLDDGSLVPACKKVLSENSPVFEAMFRGGFRESEETQVRIHDVSAVCLEHFVRLVDVYCECTLPTNVSTLLELAAVADRFMVAGLSGQAIAHLMNSKLDYRSCKEIYQWAVSSHLPLALKVSRDVIKYLFTANMSRCQLRKALGSMIEDDKFKECFLRDVGLMIRDALSNN